MSRKEDLKLLFNFMIELLKDEKTETEKSDSKLTTVDSYEPAKKTIVDNHKEETKEETKEDEQTKHILDVMKRVEVLDKLRKPKTLIPVTQRDEEQQAEMDKSIIKNHESEKKGINHLKNALLNAKEFMGELETKKPLVPSVPLHELNELETKRAMSKAEENKNTNPQETKQTKKNKK
jgi:hypothetical protein